MQYNVKLNVITNDIWFILCDAHYKDYRPSGFMFSTYFQIWIHISFFKSLVVLAD